MHVQRVKVVSDFFAVLFVEVQEIFLVLVSDPLAETVVLNLLEIVLGVLLPFLLHPFQVFVAKFLQPHRLDVLSQLVGNLTVQSSFRKHDFLFFMTVEVKL